MNTPDSNASRSRFRRIQCFFSKKRNEAAAAAPREQRDKCAERGRRQRAGQHQRQGLALPPDRQHVALAGCSGVTFTRSRSPAMEFNDECDCFFCTL